MTPSSPLWTTVAIVLQVLSLFAFIKLINFIASLIPSHETSMVRLQTYIRNLEAFEEMDTWQYARHGVRQRRKLALQSARSILNRAWNYSRFQLKRLADGIEAEWHTAIIEMRDDARAREYADERLIYAEDRLDVVANTYGGGIFCDVSEARRMFVQAQRLMAQNRYEDAGETAEMSRLKAAEAEGKARHEMERLAIDVIVPLIQSTMERSYARSQPVKLGACQVVVEAYRNG